MLLRYTTPPPFWRDEILGEVSDPDLENSAYAPLGEPVDEYIRTEPTTRRILRTQNIPDNPHDPSATISATLMAQRRLPGQSRNGEEWADADSFSLTRLRANEQVKLDLGPNQTKTLFLALARRYQETSHLHEILRGIDVEAVSSDDALVVRGRERETLEKLLEQNGDEVWEHLRQLQPDMMMNVALRLQHEERLAALRTFESQMNDEDWSEGDWERFFIANTWIFGFGLSYKFLSTVQNQPHLGGTTVTGSGAERGDFLMRSEAEVRFTVLVDIKKPNTALMHRRPYRNGIYRPDNELGGGVAQLQANCNTWAVEGSRSPQNLRSLAEGQIFTHEPKGILVIGRTSEFAEDDDKRGSFERFRRLLQNPEVITFDELYERAVHLVATESAPHMESKERRP